MITQPITSPSCIQSGIIVSLYAINADNIPAMPFPVHDATQHTIVDNIVTDTSINCALVKPLDVEAQYEVQGSQGPSGLSYQQTISLMVPQHTAQYSALIARYGNSPLVFIAKLPDNSVILLGTKEQPLTLAPKLGNNLVVQSPGFDLVFSGNTTNLPYHYTGTTSHPSGILDYLKTY